LSSGYTSQTEAESLSNGEYRLISRYSFTPDDYFSFIKKGSGDDDDDQSGSDLGILCGNGWYCTRVPINYEQSVREVFGNKGLGDGKLWPSLISQITVSLLDQITQYIQ
jgi:hypothetical protein